MKKTFKVGQRVGTFVDESEDGLTANPKPSGNTCDYEPEFGEVAEILSDGNVMVVFDNEYLNKKEYDTKTGDMKTGDKPVCIKTNLLLSEDETKSMQSELEKEYKVAAKQIKEKLAVAAQAIREAQKMAKKELGADVSEIYDALDPLYRAMDASGWNTSSFGC